MNAIKQGYKQTKVGIIPEDWEVVKLGNICKFYKGKGISKENLSEEGTPCIRYGELYTTYNEKIDNVISKTNVDIEELFLSKSNDIIIPASGETAIDIATASCVLHDNIALSGDLNVIRTKENGIFLSYYLNVVAKHRIASIAQGISVVHLYSSQLENLFLSLPPLKEQEKIAEILTTWDEAITKQEELVKAKELQKKALMQKLLSGEVRFSGFSDEWEEVRLGEIADIYQPQTISQPELTNDGFDVYGANGIIGKYHQYNHELEQIAVTCRGNTCGTVNFTKPKSWITGNAMVINLDNSTKAIKIFIYYLFLNTNFTYLISGSGQPQITGNIKNHKLKLPSLPEQQKIAEVLSLADDEINLLKNSLEELKLQKKALMQKLLTGQVRVKV